MTIADQINAGIERIETCGWTQGVYVNQAGEYCLTGSIYAACFTASGPLPVDRVIALAINSESLVLWNDEPGRTKEQVLAVMRIAASLPEAQREL